MSKSAVIIAGVLAAVLVVVAFSLNSGSDTRPTQQGNIGKPFLPELNENLNNVTKFVVKTGSNEVVLARENDRWVVESKNGYPAKMEEVRQTLLALNDLKYEEKKTSNPDAFEEIQLREVTPDTTSKQVIVYTDDNTEIVNALFGKTNYGSGGSAGRGTQFARLNDENQTWLVDNYLTLSADPNRWIETTFLDIENSRVSSISITSGEGEPVVLERQSEDENSFDFVNMPEGREMKSDSITNAMAGVLRSVRLDDVQPRSEFDPDANPMTTTIVTTFDGLIVQADVYHLDDKRHLIISTSTTDNASEEVAEESSNLNATLESWVYEVPRHLSSRLERDIDYFTQEIEEIAEEIEGPSAVLEPGAPAASDDPVDQLESTTDDPDPTVDSLRDEAEEASTEIMEDLQRVTEEATDSSEEKTTRE